MSGSPVPKFGGDPDEVMGELARFIDSRQQGYDGSRAGGLAGAPQILTATSQPVDPEAIAIEEARERREYVARLHQERARQAERERDVLLREADEARQDQESADSFSLAMAAYDEGESGQLIARDLDGQALQMFLQEWSADEPLEAEHYLQARSMEEERLAQSAAATREMFARQQAESAAAAQEEEIIDQVERADADFRAAHPDLSEEEIVQVLSLANVRPDVADFDGRLGDLFEESLERARVGNAETKRATQEADIKNDLLRQMRNDLVDGLTQGPDEHARQAERLAAIERGVIDPIELVDVNRLAPTVPAPGPVDGIAALLAGERKRSEYVQGAGQRAADAHRGASPNPSIAEIQDGYLADPRTRPLGSTVPQAESARMEAHLQAERKLRADIGAHKADS